MRKVIGIILHRNFERSYARQIAEVRDAFRERAKLLLIDPDHPLLAPHPLQGKLKGYWSINVTGDVRAVFKREGYIAIFVEIGTHDQLYRL